MEKLFRTYLLSLQTSIIIFCTFPCGIKFASASDVTVKGVPAIYSSEIQNVSLYEATIPIFFHVELPKLPDEFHGYTINCSGNETSGGGGYYCLLEKQFIAASNHIIKELQIQRTQFGEESQLLYSSSRRKRQAAPVIAATSLLAGFLLRPAISKLTGKLFGTDEEWTGHFNAIRDSLLREHELLLDFEHSTHAYTQEMEMILTNMSEILTEQKRDLVWSLRLLSTKMHADIIQNAIQSCKTKHIPGNLIHYNFLKKTLSALDKNLTQTFDYTLAIGLNEIGKYYKLPIADCLFTASKAHITVNIPLVRKNINWKLHEIIHTKYAFKNQVCELYPQEAAYLAISDHTDEDKAGNHAVLITDQMLQYCSIYEHQICMVPRFAKDSVQSLRCTAGMHQNLDSRELLKSCSFRCYSNEELIITQISSSKLVVTNAVNLTYQCGDNPEKVLRFERLGAIEVNLDCDCSVIINGYEKLPKPFPCFGNKTENPLQQLLNFTVPILWTRNFSTLEHVEDHEELSQHINHDWPWLIPVFNFTKEKVENFTIPEKAVYSAFFTVELWLGLLTLALLLHIILTFYCFFKIFLARFAGYNLPFDQSNEFANEKDRQYQQNIRRHSLREKERPRSGIELEIQSTEEMMFHNKNKVVNKLI